VDWAPAIRDRINKSAEWVIDFFMILVLSVTKIRVHFRKHIQITYMKYYDLIAKFPDK
jgi:hypothetical protein